MIFYRKKTERGLGWIPMSHWVTEITKEEFEKDFKGYEIMIRKQVYRQWSEEFDEAVKAEAMWDRLTANF